MDTDGSAERRASISFGESCLGFERISEDTLAWIQAIPVELLPAACRSFGLEMAGTGAELREQLLQHFRDQGTATIAPEKRPDPVLTTELTRVPVNSSVMAVNSSMNFHRWRVTFDGKTDPMAFLERLEELRIQHQISADRVLPVLPEFLTGNSLLWYRNNVRKWQSWKDFERDFQEFYLPTDYWIHLEAEIGQRCQKEGETVNEYIVALQTLIRRHGKMSAEQELFWIHRNLRPEYRHYIRRSDCTSLSRLLIMAKEFEDLQRETQARSRTVSVPRARWAPKFPEETPIADLRTLPLKERKEVVSKRTVKEPTVVRPSPQCWRCGRPGHLRSTCNFPPAVFCSRCGKQGVMSRDCPCGKPRTEN